MLYFSASNGFWSKPEGIGMSISVLCSPPVHLHPCLCCVSYSAGKLNQVCKIIRNKLFILFERGKCKELVVECFQEVSVLRIFISC